MVGYYTGARAAPDALGFGGAGAKELAGLIEDKLRLSRALRGANPRLAPEPSTRGARAGEIGLCSERRGVADPVTGGEYVALLRRTLREAFLVARSSLRGDVAGLLRSRLGARRRWLKILRRFGAGLTDG